MSSIATRREVSPAITLVSLLLISGACSGCAHPEPPEALVELRRVVSGPAFTQGRTAAPDLGAEAERSLSTAEAALEDRDTARARWMATLGGIQARTTVALARQQAAEARRAAAARATGEVEEDLARFRSQRADALRDIERLEAMNGGAAAED